MEVYSEMMTRITKTPLAKYLKLNSNSIEIEIGDLRGEIIENCNAGRLFISCINEADVDHLTIELRRLGFTISNIPFKDGDKYKGNLSYNDPELEIEVFSLNH